MKLSARRPGLPRLRRLRAVALPEAIDWRWLFFGLTAGVLCALGVLVVSAPAVWLDWGVAQATQGRVRLAQAQGTVWNGSARIVLADLRDARQTQSDLGGRSDRAERSGGALAGLSIPGAFSWALQPGALLSGRIELDLRHSSQTLPSRISAGLSGVAITRGAMSLPSLALERLGSPWNSLRPAASVQLAWDDWQFDPQGRARGRVVVELSGVSAAVSSVRPLGTYRGELVSSGEQARVILSTLTGPLHLEGNGQWTRRSGLSMTAQAWADPQESDRLQPMLSLMGRREGDKIIIRFGA
jgi:general secretion pathway protein N